MSLKSWLKRSPRAKRVALLAMRTAAALRPAGLARIPRFVSDWRRFRSAGGSAPALDLYPCLFDRTGETQIDAQYFHQAIWATKRIFATGVKSHVDVGSHVFFIGTLTAFAEVTFVDIRPISTPVERLSMKKGSIVALPFETGSLQSLSSLHVIEHIGLGRYGDPIDPDGAVRAAAELQRVLAPGGRLYLSTPIGRSRVQFNSQRIFDPRAIVELFEVCRLVELSVVDAAGTFRENASIDSDIDVVSGNDFGLGMFLFEKIR